MALATIAEATSSGLRMEPIYRLQGLTKVFDGTLTAVNAVDLEIPSGEKVAVIGPSGAGKTTLFRLLNLTVRLTSGGLWIGGQEVGGLHGARLTQHQIAAMTGSVREVVQRALKALERDGAIRMERARVVVLDPKALERWSESTGSPAA
jgi:ABC-type oligopeptide transport system ATPase subunit